MSVNKEYNKRTWLNPEKSASTGSIVAFDGNETWRGKTERNTFLAISDCNVSARLHKTEGDTYIDFINKMKLLKHEINNFIIHLETEL